MTKNKLKPIDVSKYTVTDTGQVLKMNKEVEVIQRPTYAELEKEVEELEAQIEKMKCCGNCSHFKLDNNGLYPIYMCELTYPNKCKNHDKWELRR